MSTNLSSWPGVGETWPVFTPAPWSAEYVAGAVTAYLAGTSIPGLRSVFEAKPLAWDDPANFYGTSQPWGASGYVYSGKEAQGKLYTGEGRPLRTVRHDVALICLFRSTINDTTAVTILQRRIEDAIKQAIRQDPTLGGRVFEAGVKMLEASRDVPRSTGNVGHDVEFYVEFEVTVYAPPGN